MVGVVRRYDLCDIADAIRQRNGSSELYRPSEMAAAIRALDGKEVAPGGIQPRTGSPYGLIDDSVLTDIADAIRAQNGTTTRYRTSEMAEAILGIAFGTVPLARRALLCDDGTLEFTYLEREDSPSSRSVTKAIGVPATAPASMGDTPWYADRDSIRRVTFDRSFADSATPSLDYWFDNLIQLTEVSGLAYVSGCTSMRAAMGHDTKLLTVDMSGMDMGSLADVSEAFVGSSALKYILMSEGQRPPDGCKGSMTFAGCTSVIGGNGTAYSTKHLGGDYLRPDVEGEPGYGTVRRVLTPTA